LLLAVAAMMVVMAVPSAGAQNQQSEYCLHNDLNQNFNPTDPEGPISGTTSCFNSLKECLDNREHEDDYCVPVGDITSAYGQTTQQAQKEK